MTFWVGPQLGFGTTGRRLGEKIEVNQLLLTYAYKHLGMWGATNCG
jgi:hypothetical protein